MQQRRRKEANAPASIPPPPSLSRCPPPPPPRGPAGRPAVKPKKRKSTSATIGWQVETLQQPQPSTANQSCPAGNSPNGGRASASCVKFDLRIQINTTVDISSTLWPGTTQPRTQACHEEPPPEASRKDCELCDELEVVLHSNLSMEGDDLTLPRRYERMPCPNERVRASWKDFMRPWPSPD